MFMFSMFLTLRIEQKELCYRSRTRLGVWYHVINNRPKCMRFNHTNLYIQTYSSSSLLIVVCIHILSSQISVSLLIFLHFNTNVYLFSIFLHIIIYSCSYSTFIFTHLLIYIHDHSSIIHTHSYSVILIITHKHTQLILSTLIRLIFALNLVISYLYHHY